MTEYHAYQDLARYPIELDVRERLFAAQTECAVVWTTRDGWPIGVIHWFVWHNERFWVTSTSERLRVAALRARPRACVIVSSAGTDLRPNRSVSAKTLATVHDDDETKGWFFPALAAKAFPGSPRRADHFERMLLGTSRVAIELEPVRFSSYDGLMMTAAIAGARE